MHADGGWGTTQSKASLMDKPKNSGNDRTKSPIRTGKESEWNMTREQTDTIDWEKCIKGEEGRASQLDLIVTEQGHQKRGRENNFDEKKRRKNTADRLPRSAHCRPAPKGLKETISKGVGTVALHDILIRIESIHRPLLYGTQC